MKIKSFLFFLALFSLSKKIIAHPQADITAVFRDVTYKGLYTSYLQKLNKNTATQWRMTEISNLDHIPQASGPTEKFFNRTIIWAYDQKGNLLAGFRPINTTTGCKSGCTPVIFHLVIDLQGNTKDLIIDEAYPLRKVGHQKFTTEDYKKLTTLLKKLPHHLRLVQDPLHLTDNDSSFPPQTWTFFQDTLIKGGAYTSYAVYTNAFNTKDFMSESSTTKDKELKEQQAIQNLFSSDRHLEDYHLRLLDKISSLLKTNLSEKSQANLLNYVLLICANLCIENKKLTPKDLKKIINYINEYSNLFLTSQQTPFFDFLTNLVHSDQGAQFLLGLQKNLKSWHQIPQHLQRFLPYLAYAKLKKTKQLKDLQTHVDNTSLLNYSKTKPHLLELYTDSLLLLNFNHLALKSVAALKTRFPKHPYKFPGPLTKSQEEVLRNYEKDEAHQYSYELSRDFHNNKEKIPKVKAKRAFHKIPKVQEIPVERENKEIHIFFAPWCAHCFEHIKTLSEKASPEFWKKTQLIAVFIKDASLKNVEEFLKYSTLKEKHPQVYSEIFVIEESDESQEFYEKMNLYAVPKFVITNKKGEILNYNYEMSLNPYKDFEKDLDLALAPGL